MRKRERLEKCAVGWCQRPDQVRGYCTTHYQRFLRGKDMDAPHLERKAPDKTRGECSWEGCGRIVHAAGFCNAHYTRNRNGRPMGDPIREKSSQAKCGMSNCELPHHTSGACLQHYRLGWKHNLSVIQLDMLLLDAVCEICGNDSGPFHIDHDHSCCPGKGSCGRCIRGVLCQGCNTGMGQMLDSKVVLLSAVRYLERYEDAVE